MKVIHRASVTPCNQPAGNQLGIGVQRNTRPKAAMDGNDELNEQVDRGSRLAKHLAEHLKWMGADEAKFQHVDEEGSVYRVKIQRDPISTKQGFPVLRHLQQSLLRVVARAPAFRDFVAKSLDEIRLCAHGNVTIHLSMLRLLSRVAGRTNEPARRRVLLEHGRLIVDLAHDTVPAPYDRERINVEIKILRGALEDGTELTPLLNSLSRSIAGAGIVAP